MIRIASLLCLLLLVLPSPAVAAPQTPAEFLGRPVGEDRHLFGWETILSYLDHLAAESDRMELLELGRSTEGRRFVMAVVADEKGLREAEAHRARVRELYRVDETNERRAREIAREGRAILAFSLGLHSTEVGAAQASMEILYELVTAEDDVTRMARERLLILLVPCMNPDGLDLVRDWYMQTLGTDAEGTSPVELYHPYAGHDNNRDGFFNNLVETAMWSKALYHDWLPQMVVDEHQMGSNGPRLFLPPFDDPISPTVHPLVYTQLSAAGQQAVSDLTGLGWTGIVTSTIFTGEWPGSVRSTGFWHNMLGVLSEVASARLATPLYFPPGSLQARGRGLDEYERRANFLAPWQGGWWRLRDIVDLEVDLTFTFLRWASHHKEDLLLNFWRMNRDAVAQGRNGPPYAFVIPDDQIDRGSDDRLVEILRLGGVEVDRARGPLRFDGREVVEGSWVVRADQPFRPFVVEMLSRTEYPRVEHEGEPVRPYDVTAWQLSELLGVRVFEVDEYGALSTFDLEEDGVAPAPPRAATGDVAIFPPEDLASHGLANDAIEAGYAVSRGETGAFVVTAPADALSRLVRERGARPSVLPGAGPASRLRSPRIGLYSPWGGSMDEGWTRLVLERFGFGYERIRPGQPDLSGSGAGRRLHSRFDVILLPSIDAATIREGHSGPGRPRVGEVVWPEEYRGGIGPDAGDAFRDFVEAGGRVVAISASTPWVIDALGLPVRAVGGGEENEVVAPGTLLRLDLDEESWLTRGYRGPVSAYFANGYTFETRAWTRPTEVAATWAKRDLLVAGFLDGGRELAGRPAIVSVPVGEGEVVLFGFHPQRRAQTEGTFKLLFNALWPR